MPNMILYNGKIHTQDSNFPWVTALAIRKSHILAVGTDDDIRALAGSNTRCIDLGGRRVVPGLTDAHFHYWDWAISRRWLNLADAVSLPDVLKRVAQVASRTPPRGWILGRGWNEVAWSSQDMPDRKELDKVAPNHPVILWRYDMHLAAVNSAALKKAGITAATAQPTRGIIDHDATGQPSGVLRELAINLVSDLIPLPSEDKAVQAMLEGFGVLHQLGLTGIHDFRIMGGAEGPPAFRAWQRLQEAGELTMRVWMNLAGEQMSEAVYLGIRTGFGDRLRIGHVKLFADGGQGARTAWMIEPYEDGGSGMPLVPPAELAEKITLAHSAGLAVAVHAIGDRANRELLNVFEQVLGAAKDGQADSSSAEPAAPHRIEHVQVIHTSDVARIAYLNLVASVQPIHVSDDYPMIDASVGSRGRFGYPFRDMIDAGVTLAMGSDCPVADPNPLWGIHAAVTRQRRDGDPEGGWFPAQRLTVAEALWGFTMGPARACGQEAILGSLTPGKLADLVVLDRDIFSIEPMEIAEARVWMTVFDGQVVFER